MADIMVWAQQVQVDHITPLMIGWFIRMHYKTTKEALKKVMGTYAGIREGMRGSDKRVPMLGKVNLCSLILSNPYYYMYPDLKMKSHGWDMRKDKGDILDMIGDVWDELVMNIREDGNMNRRAELIGSLSHLIADLHTIGQISSEFWGKVDDRIDMWSEFCAAGKIKRGAYELYPVLTKEELLEELHRHIKRTYMTWAGKAKEWKKCVYKRWCWLWPFRVRKYAKVQTAIASDAIALALVSVYAAASSKVVEDSPIGKEEHGAKKKNLKKQS